MILESSFILEPSAAVWTGKGPYFLMDRDLVSIETAYFEESFVTVWTLVPLLLIMHLPDVPLESVELREAFPTLITLFHSYPRCFIRVCFSFDFCSWKYFPFEKVKLGHIAMSDDTDKSIYLNLGDFLSCEVWY